MEPINVVCSKCQSNTQAVPGTAHIGCGGTYIPTEGVGQKYKFSSPISMQVFMMLDRLVSDINFCAGQFQFMNQPNLQKTVAQLTNAAIQLRDTFYKQDQGGIVVVGPNGVPKA